MFLSRILAIAFAQIFFIQASSFAYTSKSPDYKDAVAILKNMSLSDKEAFFDSFSLKRTGEEQHYLKNSGEIPDIRHSILRSP
jgi:hypothetical protein